MASLLNFLYNIGSTTGEKSEGQVWVDDGVGGGPHQIKKKNVNYFCFNQNCIHYTSHYVLGRRVES